MTPDELRTACREAIALGIGLTLEGAEGAGQPIRGLRAELLCVNGDGRSVYRYSPRQVVRIAKMLREVA